MKPQFIKGDKVSVRSGTYSTFLGELVYHWGWTNVFHRGVIQYDVMYDKVYEEYIYSVKLRGQYVYIRESFLRKDLL